MRYFGTFSGKIINETKQKVYQNGEEPEYWDAFYAELLNVTDEVGDYCLHLWLPLKQGLYLEKKEEAIVADVTSRNIKSKCRKLVMQ